MDGWDGHHRSMVFYKHLWNGAKNHVIWTTRNGVIQLRTLGLLLADGALKVGWGKTF